MDGRMIHFTVISSHHSGITRQQNYRLQYASDSIIYVCEQKKLSIISHFISLISYLYAKIYFLGNVIH